MSYAGGVVAVEVVVVAVAVIVVVVAGVFVVVVPRHERPRQRAASVKKARAGAGVQQYRKAGLKRRSDDHDDDDDYKHAGLLPATSSREGTYPPAFFLQSSFSSTSSQSTRSVHLQWLTAALRQWLACFETWSPPQPWPDARIFNVVS